MKKFFSFILSIATIAAVCYGVYKYILPSDSRTTLNEDFGQDVSVVAIEASLLQIKVKEGSSFAVEYDGSEKLCPTCTYDENSKKLSITQPEYKPKKSKTSNENELILYMPEGTRLSQFKLVNNIGDVDLGELSADQIVIIADIGTIKADKITTDELKIEANLGDVNIDECDSKDITVVANMGSVDIGIASDLKDYGISASTTLGELKIGSEKYKNNYVQTGNAGAIKIQCNLGNVVIE